MVRNSLFVIPKPVFQPHLRIFCFPYAGGTTNTYANWVTQFDNNIELILVQPPGRGSRIAEDAHQSMAPLVREIMLHSSVFQEGPFIFFGHSLGSRVAYELSYQLMLTGLPLPRYLIASGSRAPHLPNKAEPSYNLPKEQFLQKLFDLNGTPKEILEHPELMELLLPLLRADFKIAETYVANKTALPFPILAINGDGDTEITPDQISAWQDLTSHRFQSEQVEGDHFFVNTNPAPVTELIRHLIKDSLTPMKSAQIREKTAVNFV